jgi:hypothetical protein
VGRCWIQKQMVMQEYIIYFYSHSAYMTINFAPINHLCPMGHALALLARIISQISFWPQF